MGKPRPNVRTVLELESIVFINTHIKDLKQKISENKALLNKSDRDKEHLNIYKERLNNMITLKRNWNKKYNNTFSKRDLDNGDIKYINTESNIKLEISFSNALDKYVVYLNAKVVDKITNFDILFKRVSKLAIKHNLTLVRGK